MSKKIRDSIFIIFIFLFIVLTIGVSLYATGYRFNLRFPIRLDAFLVKTGMLVVNTEPSGVKIYLNDRPQANPSLKFWSQDYAVTPAKIKNILPGDYTLRLEKPGYWPFQKKISIHSGQTAFAENINLFRSDLPIMVASSTAGRLALSPGGRYLYVLSDQKIIDFSAETARALPETNMEGAWLKFSDRLSASGRLYDPKNENSDTDYQKIIGADTTAWYYEELSGRLYYQTKTSLSRVEANGRTNTVLLSDGPYLAYEPRGDHLYLVMSEQKKTVLKDYDLKTEKTAGQIVLPGVGEYRFVDEGKARLSLYDEKNRTLYLIDASNVANDPKTINQVANWTWSGDQELFYHNGWEIYRYDLSRSSSALLTRVSEEISGLMFSADRQYLVFSTARSLNVIDLETGLATPVFTAEKISGVALDAKNNILYFNASLGRGDNVYKLNLQ